MEWVGLGSARATTNMARCGGNVSCDRCCHCCASRESFPYLLPGRLPPPLAKVSRFHENVTSARPGRKKDGIKWGNWRLQKRWRQQWAPNQTVSQQLWLFSTQPRLCYWYLISHILVRGGSSWQIFEGLEQETNPCMDGGLVTLYIHEPLWDIQPSIRQSLFYRLYWNRMQRFRCRSE